MRAALLLLPLAHAFITPPRGLTAVTPSAPQRCRARRMTTAVAALPAARVVGLAAARTRFLAQWPLYATIPLCAGAFNALTNKLAVTMMFCPVRFRGFGPLGWQGVVPKASKRMGGDVSDLLTKDLLNVTEVLARVNAKRLAEVLCTPQLVDLGRALVKAETGGTVVTRFIKPAVVKRVCTRCVEKVQRDVDRYIDLRHLCVQRLTEDPSRLVRLFKACGRRELELVVSIGGWGGLALGLFQMGAWAACPFSWTLAAGGALVGLVTNWVALKLLFSPVEPRRILGLTWHGLFLRRQAEVSRDFAAFVASELVAPRHLWRALLTGPQRDDFVAALTDAFAEELPGGLGARGAPLRGALEAAARRGVAAVAADPAAYTDPAAAYVAEALDVAASVGAALGALPGARFEHVLHPVFEQDETTLIAVGCLLGGLVGLAQVPLY